MRKAVLLKNLLIKKFLSIFICFFMVLSVIAVTSPISARASYVDTNLNTFIHDADPTPEGVVGQDMQLTVRIGYNGKNGLYNPKTEQINNVRVRLSQDQNLINTNGIVPSANRTNPYDPDDESAESEAYNEGYQAGAARAYNASLGLTYPVDGGVYPLEINSSTMTQEKKLGTLKKGEYVEVTFNVHLRSDIKAGYYGVPVSIFYDVPENPSGSYGSLNRAEFINISVIDQGEITDPASTEKESAFAVGENQATPAASYPSQMAYTVNFRNQTNRTLYDVKVHMENALDPTKEFQNTAYSKASASKQFPFEISQSNYDQTFEAVTPEEIITPAYVLNIKKNAASGYYPIDYTVTYKRTPDATLQSKETHTFYVNINNPSMNDTEPDSTREFNANDRTKARLVVGSYHTEPEAVFAGQPFKLFVEIENASTNINASNILLTVESEKVDNSNVFSTENGSNSTVINSLNAGESKEVSWTMIAGAGVNPRAYAITVNEKYDSPEFKNAEEKVTLDVEVKQIPRLSCTGFDIMPPSVTVGSESNVMFNINNTGKVILYNVTVAFEADSIQNTSAYVGNIKPGETGNVDAMITGFSPTTDDGTIHVTITYEDINGETSSQEETINLYVIEDIPEDLERVTPEEADPAKASSINSFIIPGAVIAGILGALGIIFFIRKKKKEKEQKQGTDETI
ncbi:Uncharacterized conserved protein [Oribacterium sp. KHPX15]|uniref:COG1361 S-layer family protein n=1 Tax=Oribacterium sp. KHPX15 TaxID=1855342 RepID=UPI000898A213|nr:CARDB domain-containing protein [Oribacterium sp. KHPX15]SDZ87611.1 Uncharacterized conserved protein [Oribacterium sp. KHPX15]